MRPCRGNVQNRQIHGARKMSACGGVGVGWGWGDEGGEDEEQRVTLVGTGCLWGDDGNAVGLSQGDGCGTQRK